MSDKAKHFRNSISWGTPLTLSGAAQEGVVIGSQWGRGTHTSFDFSKQHYCSILDCTTDTAGQAVDLPISASVVGCPCISRCSAPLAVVGFKTLLCAQSPGVKRIGRPKKGYLANCYATSWLQDCCNRPEVVQS